ncbi:MAG TPA: glycosyltransferase family 9 protein [Bacteroidia bacterium]|nr:glycosyltransferase family 9 protein [Bacteroidia bacterium]
MNVNRKIRIDRLLGLPIVYCLNIAARILGFILRINHRLERDYKTIVVAKFLGLGSIVQATPLLQTLKNKFPNSKIIFVTSTENIFLLKHIPIIDEVIALSDKKISSLIFSTYTLLQKLWKQKIDLYIDLEIYSNFSSIITTCSLATNRFGFFKSDKNYRMGMYTHMMYFNLQAPISEIYLQFARLLGCTDLAHDLLIPQLSEAEKQNAEKTLNSFKLKENLYIVINPNASELRLERRWDKENFKAVIQHLLTERKEYKIVLIGNSKEQAYVKTISMNFSEKVNFVDTSGKLTLLELLILIEKSALLVSNDTGPMHLAFALKKKTVALFGPCSPTHYGNSENCIALYKKVYCSPCVHEFVIPPCKGDNQCMKKIISTEVIDAIDVALSSTEQQKKQNAIVYENETGQPLGVVLRQKEKHFQTKSKD